MKRSHTQGYLSTYMSTIKCFPEYITTCFDLRLTPLCAECKTESFMNLSMMNFLFKAPLTYSTHSSALVLPGNVGYTESNGSIGIKLPLK